jgi:hypothetical protein
MITYHGRDTERAAIVFVVGDGDRHPLPLRLDLENHSPTGFAWGYGGSGPAQLALALIAHATGDDQLAVKLHQQFKWKLINKLRGDWSMTDAMVCDAVAAIWADQPEDVA